MAAVELTTLRARLNADEQQVVRTLWRHRCREGSWMPARLLHHQLGTTRAREIVGRLGGSIAQHHRASGNDPERYELTTLGMLLTEDGPRLEGMLVRFVETMVLRFRADPTSTEVAGAEIEVALALKPGEVAQLHALLQDHGSTPMFTWTAGGVSRSPGGWRVPMLYKVDEVSEESDFAGYVRHEVEARYDADCPADADARSTYLSRRYAEARGDELPFLAEGPLKRQLANDLHEMEAVHGVSAWKSCVILCGGILEGLLYSELVRTKEAARGAKAAPKKPLERWGLEDLLETATELRVFDPATLSVSDAVRHYRNLIHPARLIAAPVVIDRHEADIARGAVRVTLRELLNRHRA